MSLLLVPTGSVPVEEEFATKEKELTDAVIKVIAMAKKETMEITTESTKANIVEACKSAASFTFEFQALMKGKKLILIAEKSAFSIVQIFLLLISFCFTVIQI